MTQIVDVCRKHNVISKVILKTAILLMRKKLNYAK